MNVQENDTCLSELVGENRVDHSSHEDVDLRKPQWSNKFQGIIALLGLSVGLGNLLRFPYVCQKNGGGAFLIPYVISMAVMVIPLFILEVAFGLGISVLIVSCIAVPCYSMMFAWALYYIYSSFSAVLPWTSCGNPWNTPQCVVVGGPGLNSSVCAHTTPAQANNRTECTTANTGYADKEGTQETSNTTLHRSIEEFWQNKALGVSTGIDDLGSMQPHLVICWFITCVVAFLSIMKGIKSLGKVVYVTVLMPYVLLLVLLVRSCTMPGAVDGIMVYLTPDFTRLQHPQVWLEALVQILFSVGLAWGTLIAMASHNSFHTNLIRDSIIVAVIGELTSVFAGFVVFATVGFLAHSLRRPVSDVVTFGPGFGFIIYPEAVALLPLPQMWSVFFFITMLMMAVDSVFAQVEAAIGCMEDLLPRRFHIRHLQTIMAAVFMGAVFLVGLVFTTHGGVYVFQLVDWYFAAVTCYVIAVLVCVAVGWCYGKDIYKMYSFRFPTKVALIYLASYTPPSYGGYEYPQSAVIWGGRVA